MNHCFDAAYCLIIGALASFVLLLVKYYLPWGHTLEVDYLLVVVVLAATVIGFRQRKIMEKLQEILDDMQKKAGPPSESQDKSVPDESSL